MNHDTVITLIINQSDTPPKYLLDIKVNDEGLVSNSEFSVDDTRVLQSISNKFNSYFECRPPVLSPDSQAIMGEQLFKILLSSHWDEIKKKIIIGSRRVLVIASPASDVLNLPWELLRPPGDRHLGIDPRFSIRRLPSAKEMPRFEGDLRPRPLRLLFMACAPIDQDPLDYELEEKRLLEALSGSDLAFESGDLGTYEELCERVESFEPHIVHISGHGLVKDGKGLFCFENDAGLTDYRSSEEIADSLVGKNVQFIFVSGCQTSKSPAFEALKGICQGLVNYEIPMAMGWAAPIADNLATQFASTFYRSLTSQPVDGALTTARKNVWEQCKNQGDLSWTLPNLYVSTTQSRVVDPDLNRKSVEPIRKTMVQLPLKDMLEGFAEHFVGRRREQQRLIPAFRTNKLQVLILSGMGGCGKSSLATRIARKLETEGFLLIPVASSQNHPLSSAKMMEACRGAFIQAANKHLAQGQEIKARELEAACKRLRDAKMPARDRLRQIVSTLNDFKFLLVLDNFESNLRDDNRTIKYEDISDFYPYLLRNLSGQSKVIITSRYLPANEPILPPGVMEVKLGDLTEASFIKILRQDKRVEERYRSGDLPLELLKDLYKKLGGTPKFLLQMREALKEMGQTEIKAEIEKFELPEESEPGKLQELRNEYFEKIITTRLYNDMQPQERKALSRFAVYGISVNLDALVSVCAESREALSRFIASWQERAFVYLDAGRTGSGQLWTIYGLMRGWLMEQLTSEEKKHAHMDAGDFLWDLNQKDKGRSLNLDPIAMLYEIRAQYMLACNFDRARSATNQISRILLRRGIYEELKQVNQELYNCVPHPHTMDWIGQSYFLRGDYDLAKEWFQRELSASAENSTEASSAWHQLATIDIYQGHYQDAKKKSNKSLQICQELEDYAGVAAAWYQLASIDLYQGHYEEVQEKFCISLQIYQDIGDLAGEAATWHQLTAIDIFQGHYQDAQEKSWKSLRIYQDIEDRAGLAAAWRQLATIDMHQGYYKESLMKFYKSLKICQDIEDRAGEAATSYQIGSINLDQGYYQNAQEKFYKSMQIDQELGDRAGEAATWHQLGYLAIKQGRIEEGTKLMAICYLIDRSIGYEETNKDFDALLRSASKLGYSMEQIDAMIKEAWESYTKDRGLALINAAFNP